MKSPLADRIRPQSLEDFVGQKHLIAQGKPLRNIIDSSNEIPNMIFYGPSGVGKSTLAKLLSIVSDYNLYFHTDFHLILLYPSPLKKI